MPRLVKGQAAALLEGNIRNQSFLSKLFLLPQYAVVSQGRAGKLQKDELRMESNLACETSSKKFDDAWANERARAAKLGQPPSLIRALVKAFGVDFLLGGIWKATWSVFVILGAFYFVRSLVQFVSDPETNPNIYNQSNIPNNGVGWILSCAFFLDSILVGIALQRMGDVCVRGGIKARSALMTAVYRKVFALSSVHNEGSGNVVSLVSTDCGKVYEGVLHFQNVWTAPLEAAAIIALLLSLTKEYGLPALGIVVFVLPLQYYFGYLIAKYKHDTVEVSDARVLRMQEILLAVKLVKFYVWENRFAKSISEVRKQEVELMRKTAVIKTLNLCLVFAVPPVIALVIFATYVFNKGPFDSVFSFTILSLFNTLRFPLVVLPKALRGSSEMLASIKRLQQFLLLDEAKDHEKSSNVEARFEDAELVHYAKSETEDFKLKIPKFEVKPGQVVAIVGRVGAGKSSIFMAILENMRLQKGKMGVGGDIAYVPQSPWVQNLTLRDNILFGLPYDESRYKEVIHACALELDLQILPAGDQSMAGERGINLSGGQRQRVCLARAAYHPSDIVLLDNPLSAVDQHTAIHIFNKCIKGMLKDKAVIWITHQLELLPNCDNVAIMEDGNMTYFGPYNGDILNQRLPVDHLLFATVEAGESGVKKEESTAPSANNSAHGAAPLATAATSSPIKEGDQLPAGSMTPSKRKSFQRSSHPGLRPVDSVGHLLNEITKEEEAKEHAAHAHEGDGHGHGHGSRRSSHDHGPLRRVSESQDEAALEQTEEQIAAQFNGMPYRLSPRRALMVFCRAGGLVFGLWCFYIFMATQTCRIYSDQWIRYWAADYFNLYPKIVNGENVNEFDTLDEASRMYLLTYLGLVVTFIMLLLCRDTMFSIWHIRGSTNLHNILFSRVLKAPILFFLRTPVGDVLNSFAKDQDTLDETLPDTLHMSLIYLMILLTSLGIVTASIYYYAALTAALIATFVIMQQLYLPAATVLKRWAGETASQVYVHVDESLHGMDVIKAFRASDYFIQENVARINEHHLALFNTEQCHLWLAFWCDFFGAILVVATCLFSVGLKDDLGPAPVGLAISNTIQVLVFFTWVVRGAADTVSMWDAVERVTSFCTNIPEEANYYKSIMSLAEEENSQRGGQASENYMYGAPPPPPGASMVGKSKKSANGSKAGLSQPLGTEMVSVKIDSVMTGGPGKSVIDLDGNDLTHWPKTGDIMFEKVCLRYYPGAPLALKYVSFHIKDKEKIGVVGRTGSGKTTLLMALFRMFELAFGRIVIDGVDVARVPLREVRGRLAIIPQEPVMFKGTVRSNLDPFEEKSDEDLWHALDVVHMKQAVSDMGGLDADVAEGGSNFSLGQKQLVCMGRCVLKDTRVLVLDEATAAMDLQTDSLIQKTIRRVFQERTTITIAHRLDTIIFSDRIVAMASGQLREFDTPLRLLSNPASMFNKLVEDTGPHASASLRRMAAEGPKDDA